MTQRRAWVEQVMGLPVSVHVRGPDVRSTRTELCVADLFAQLRRADEVFSTYRPDSEIARWERGELALGEADPAVAEVLRLCEVARERTGGCFDARSLPDPLDDGPRFDPSGLVKGWAVQRAADHLTVLDGHDWCVNAGGDILARSGPGSRPWRVGVEDPDEPARLLAAVDVTAGAVATSGSAHRGAHIVDPRRDRPATALPASDLCAVTVVGPSLLWADVYATAAFVRGPDAWGWLMTVDGYEALVVDRLGRVETTPGWPGTPRLA
jgi:thiamine biosynthesis lipoprotein